MIIFTLYITFQSIKGILNDSPFLNHLVSTQCVLVVVEVVVVLSQITCQTLVPASLTIWIVVVNSPACIIALLFAFKKYLIYNFYSPSSSTNIKNNVSVGRFLIFDLYTIKIVPTLKVKIYLFFHHVKFFSYNIIS